MSHSLSDPVPGIACNDADGITFHTFAPDQKLPLVVTPTRDGIDLHAWSAGNHSFIDAALLDYGGILFRGFGMNNANDLKRFISSLSKEALPYLERSSPRTHVDGNIYTSTEHPPNQWIFLHNENSYQDAWPMKIFFLCETASEQGGETPIADCRKICERIDPSLRDRLMDKGFLIVRNYNAMMGLKWETVYQSDDRAGVDAYCGGKGIRTEWLPDGSLRTFTVREKPMLHHPKSGASTWFNHGTFFHVTTLEPFIRDVLLETVPEEDLPTNTYYGDGSPIDPADLDHLRDCYRAEQIMFPWERGDLMVLDNMLTAHGRAPFKGQRKVLVGMAEAMDREKAIGMASR